MKLNGGNRMLDALKEIHRKLRGDPKLRVGFLEGSTYPDGKSVPMIAAINEFGAPSRGQPPRPFFRRMIAAKNKEWGPAIAGLLKANDYDADKSLMLAGEGIKGQLQQSIRDLTTPPLAASTIAKKGFDKPLIDSSVMINSVDYEVKR